MHLVASSGNLLGIETLGSPMISRRVVVRPRTSVSGMVEDGAGKPASGASVKPDHFLRPAYFGQEQLDYQRIKPALGIKPAVTDAEGKFGVTGLPSDWDVSLRAQKDGHEDGIGSGTIALKPGKPSLGWIMGKVTGLPVAGIRVTAVQTDSEEGRNWTSITKPDGSFEFDSLPSGTYAVFVLEAEKPVEPVGKIKVNANHTSHVTLHAIEGALVQGRVVDSATGVGIAGVMVASPETRPVLSDSDGSFSIRLLPGSGILSVAGRSQGYKDLEHELDIPEKGEVTGVTIKLSPAVRISGKVSESGKPVEGALIRLITENGPMGSAESAPDGSYSFVVEIQPQTSYLVAYDPATRWVSMTSAPDIALEPPATLSGTVKDSAGKPIPNAKILPMLHVGHLRIQALHNQTRSDANGRFTIIGLIPEVPYDLRIEAEGFKETTIPLDAKLVSGQTTTTDFVLN